MAARTLPVFIVQIEFFKSGFMAAEEVLRIINVNRLIRCQGIYDRRPAGARKMGKAVAQSVGQVCQAAADERGLIHRETIS